MNRANDNNNVDAAAALWTVRLGEGLSPAQESELDAWLAQDSRHLGALVRAEAAWSDVDRIAAMSRGRPARPSRGFNPRRYWKPASLAAGLLAAALIGGGVIHDQLTGRYAADAGEVRRILLDDGSIVTLNTDSVIRVRYEGNQRRVDLGHGEASFQVAHDSARPFVVRAGDLRVRAVGTEFVVRLEGEQVSVTVAEGVVEVKRPVPGPDPRRLIYEHDQIVAAGPVPLTPTNIGQDEVARQLAWRDGLLVFDGEALSEAAAQVNRYSATPVLIDDPALGREKFVGVFRLGDSRAFARAAAATFNARVSEESGGLHLSRTENPPAG